MFQRVMDLKKFFSQVLLPSIMIIASCFALSAQTAKRPHQLETPPNPADCVERARITSSGCPAHYTKTINDDRSITCTSPASWRNQPVPACPAGAQRTYGQSARGPYTYYECKLPHKQSNGFPACSEWEGSCWNPHVAVPCGSSASTATDYSATTDGRVKKRP